MLVLNLSIGIPEYLQSVTWRAREIGIGLADKGACMDWSRIPVVIREALPLLNAEDKALLLDYWVGTEGFGTWRKRDRAILRAWNEHARRFPKSRKACYLLSS
jgi:hypothetical protein